MAQGGLHLAANLTRNKANCIVEDRNSKRDLVLAPGEYAYMQDVTKGVIKTYTGPTVINPTAQERAVMFDAVSNRFLPCQIEEAQQCAIATEVLLHYS